MPRKPPVALKTFPDLAEEAIKELLGVLDSAVMYWRDAPKQWRDRVAKARARAVELRPWIEAERERHHV